MSEAAGRKEIELAMQTSRTDGQWHVTVQAWVRTPAGADALIRSLEIAKQLLAENETARSVAASLPAPQTTELHQDDTGRR